MHSIKSASFFYLMISELTMVYQYVFDFIPFQQQEEQGEPVVWILANSMQTNQQQL